MKCKAPAPTRTMVHYPAGSFNMQPCSLAVNLHLLQQRPTIGTSQSGPLPPPPPLPPFPTPSCPPPYPSPSPPHDLHLQMGKKDLRTLKDNEYWVTEKSDGCRLMFLAMRVPKFPRWCRVVETPEAKQYVPLDLITSAVLEDARAKRIPATKIEMEGRSYTVDLATQLATPCGGGASEAPVRLSLKCGFTFGYVQAVY